jgi:hypothetical protein
MEFQQQAAAGTKPQQRLSVTDALLQMQQAVRSGEMQQVSWHLFFFWWEVARQVAEGSRVPAGSSNFCQCVIQACMLHSGQKQERMEAEIRAAWS